MLDLCDSAVVGDSAVETTRPLCSANSRLCACSAGYLVFLTLTGYNVGSD
jgi:hypothetical protein